MKESEPKRRPTENSVRGTPSVVRQPWLYKFDVFKTLFEAESDAIEVRLRDWYP